jgi:hypothetical protein
MSSLTVFITVMFTAENILLNNFLLVRGHGHGARVAWR